MKPSSSPRWQLNLIDYLKSFRGAVVVFFAAASPVFMDQLRVAFGGEFTLDLNEIILALKIAGVSTLIELGRRFLANQEA